MKFKFKISKMVLNDGQETVFGTQQQTDKQTNQICVHMLIFCVEVVAITFSSKNGVFTGKQDQKCLKSSPAAA